MTRLRRGREGKEKGKKVIYLVSCGGACIESTLLAICMHHPPRFSETSTL